MLSCMTQWSWFHDNLLCEWGILPVHHLVISGDDEDWHLSILGDDGVPKSLSEIFVILNAARVGRGILNFNVKNGWSAQDFYDIDLRQTDVENIDDEMKDFEMEDVAWIICLEIDDILGLKIYYPKIILSKSPAPCVMTSPRTTIRMWLDL